VITAEARTSNLLLVCHECGGQESLGSGKHTIEKLANALHLFQKNHLTCKRVATGVLVTATPLVLPNLVTLAPSDPAKADADILRARMGKIG
jgi:hypothetical protein